MEKANFYGTMDKFLKDNTGSVLKMVLVPGNLLKVIHMKDNGDLTGNMERELIDIKIAYTQDNSKILSRMVKVKKYMLTEIST